MQIAFFEDKSANHFKPLTLTRPVWDLRIGILTIFQKWKRSLSPDLIVWNTTEPISEVYKSPAADSSKSVIYLNSRVLPSKALVELVKKLEPGEGLRYKETEVAYSTHSDNTKDRVDFTELEFEPVQIKYLWDMLEFNKSQIEYDINLISSVVSKTKYSENITFSNPEQIYIAESALVEPGVIIMADNGPVYVGENATIEAGAVLKGPVAICDGATVKMKARIYDGTTIGPVCKVGGEVSHSIFHSYTNKAHDGFVGNSIFGQWCNLGADTNTSNLKNNYDFVRIQDWDTKKPYKVGFQFFGTVMGDHSKTSINCMLATGTTCGVSSNIFTSDFPPKYIPSFTWLDGKENPEFRFEKALEVMKAMMARRKVELSPEYEKMMRHLSENR